MPSSLMGFGGFPDEPLSDYKSIAVVVEVRAFDSSPLLSASLNIEGRLSFHEHGVVFSEQAHDITST